MTGGGSAGLVVEIVQVGMLVRAVAGSPRLRQPQRESGALTLGAPHRDLPAVRGGHVLDDREPQTRAAGGTGAGEVHAVEALEDALLVLVGDADALIGHGDLDVVSAGCGHPAGGYAHSGTGGRVVDGVLDKVAQGGGQLTPVPPDVQVGGAAGGHGDLLGAGLVPTAVDGLGDQFVHADGFGVLEGVVVLDPGEVDQLLHQVGEPRGLDLHTAGEALHRLRVVGRVHDGLGEEGESADRRLQLMAHVRDEVASYRFDAAGLGEVLDQQEHQPGAEGATRAETASASPRPVPRRGRSSSTWRISPSRRVSRAIFSIGSTESRPPRTRPRAYAAELALTTASASSRTTAEDRRTDRTVSTPGGSTGSVCREVRVGRFWSRSLQRNASMAITPVSTPAIAAAAATAAFTSMHPG